MATHMVQSKIIMTLLGAAILLATVWFLTFYICNKKNSYAEKQILAVLPTIEEYHLKNNKYPERFEEIRKLKKIKNEKVLLFFSAPEINYQTIPNGFQIYYHQSPLGPFYGYNSIKKEWYYEE